MITTEAAFARYERLRPVLPQACFPAVSRTGRTLEDTMEDYDAYILDAFGVLNRGEAPIPGAVARIAQLRAARKAPRRADQCGKRHAVGGAGEIPSTGVRLHAR